MLPSVAQPPSSGARRIVRYAAAAIAAGCAAVYAAIGLGVVYPPNGNAQGLFVFGLSAALAFALGAALLVTTDRRAVLILGALFQVLAIIAYVQVAPRRDPPFEIWGLSLKAAQAGILIALVWLLRPLRGSSAGDA